LLRHRSTFLSARGRKLRHGTGTDGIIGRLVARYEDCAPRAVLYIPQSTTGPHHLDKQISYLCDRLGWTVELMLSTGRAPACDSTTGTPDRARHAELLIVGQPDHVIIDAAAVTFDGSAMAAAVVVSNVAAARAGRSHADAEPAILAGVALVTTGRPWTRAVVSTMLR
jgi:hypothetical protein